MLEHSNRDLPLTCLEMLTAILGIGDNVRWSMTLLVHAIIRHTGPRIGWRFISRDLMFILWLLVFHLLLVMLGSPVLLLRRVVLVSWLIVRFL